MDIYNAIKSISIFIDNNAIVLLSVCNINSNRVVNPSLLRNFFSSLKSANEDKVSSEMSSQYVFIILLFDRQGEYTIPINMAIEIIRNNALFTNVMNKIKDNIIKCFITYPDYYGILHRQAYYDQISSGITVTIPFETCLSKCYRICFTNKPSPYCTEYRQVAEEIDIENLIAQAVVEIRTLFGYSCRLSKVKKPSLSSNTPNHDRRSCRSDFPSPIPLPENTPSETHRTAESCSQNESHVSFNHFLSSSSKYMNINQKISRTATFMPMMSSKNNISKVLPA